MSLAAVGNEQAEQVEARLGELMGSINAATAALVRVIADVLERELWSVSGICSPEQWVSWQCGVSRRRAHELVSMARRRTELPEVSALFEAGLVTEDAVGAIARRVPAARDAEVAELAPLMLHTQLTRWLTALPPLPKPGSDPLADEPTRSVSFGAAGDRWRLRVDLPLDEGLVVEKALTTSRSQVFREQHPAEPDVAAWQFGVDWADGLVRMAELALTGMEPGPNRHPADRFQVLVHLDATSGDGRWHLGEALPQSLRRYLLCDADVRAVIESDGVVTAMSSKLRTVDEPMRAFVEQRDGGCVVPGCTRTRWLHIHHIRHWQDGGVTESANLCALCQSHHRMLHAGLLTIEGDPSTAFGLVVRDRHGGRLEPPPPKPPDRPPDPSPQPFRHPTGERVDWRYLAWFDEADRRYDAN